MADAGAVGYDVVTKRVYAESNIGTFTATIGHAGAASINTVAIAADGDNVNSVGSPRVGLRVSTNYTISGSVAESGVAKANRIVRIFRRDTGLLLGEVLTDGSGNFSYTVIGYNGEVSVVAYDDTGTAPDFNALIFDRVIPG